MDDLVAEGEVASGGGATKGASSNASPASPNRIAFSEPLLSLADAIAYARFDPLTFS